MQPRARHGEEGSVQPRTARLADLFSRQARRRVEDRFAAVFDNDDVATCGGQQLIRDEHAWLEQGMAKVKW